MRMLRALLAVGSALAILTLAVQPALAATQVTDFNGDGFADLAIGIPGEDVDAIADAGAVQVLYGSSTGLTTVDQLWTQDDTGTDASEDGDSFGRTLATGDFDGDGFTDLAIGVPSEDVGAIADAGAVNILYGSAIGLTNGDAQLWTQDSTDIEDSAETDDGFGSALAAGDFSGDGRSDLAVGVPLEDVEAIVDAGAVNVLYGSSSGLSATSDQLWHQDSSGILDTAEATDLFGWSLAAANFGGSAQHDLAIGSPFEDIGTVEAGAVNVLYGSSSGLTATGDQFWSQDSSGVNGVADDDDGFGWSLAAANFGKSSQSDLAIGVPFEDIGTVDAGGAVNILYGASSGLTAASDQSWSQDNSGILNVSEEDDWFGFSLAAANFGMSGYADLAVGVPREDVGATDAGAVTVLYGSSSGITATGDQFWSQDSSGVLDASEDGDFFGWTLATANFGQSSHSDLAVGVPSEDIEAIDDAGAVSVLYGSSSSGLTAAGDQFWHQDATGIQGTAEMDDFFGWSVAPRNGGILPV